MGRTDLLEQNLEQAGVDYKTIYREQDMPDRNQLSIYHVHGFLPQKPEEGGESGFKPGLFRGRLSPSIQGCLWLVKFSAA